MDEFELIRWLDVLVEAGTIQRWQTMLWSGNAPVFYVNRQQDLSARGCGEAGEALRDGQCRLIGLLAAARICLKSRTRKGSCSDSLM